MVTIATASILVYAEDAGAISTTLAPTLVDVTV